MVGLVSQMVGGTKEYVYRGLQQLPIVLASTSLVYTVATGSISHMSIFFGMAIIIPCFTFLLQSLIGWGANVIWPNSIFWKRGGGDTCNMIASSTQEKLSYYQPNVITGGAVPSYWLMGVSFYIGYAITNAVDSLLTPAAQGSSNVNHEKRNTQAVLVIITTVVFAVVVLGMRLYFMRSCEGSALGGLALSLFGALCSACIGCGIYNLSKETGARSSDLLGVLSQIIPPSSSSPHPIVCLAS